MPSFVLFVVALGCLLTGLALLAIFKVGAPEEEEEEEEEVEEEEEERVIARGRRHSKSSMHL